MYGQLPWHPQEIWAGTDFDAELTQPLEVPHADPPVPDAPGEEKLGGTLEARLITSLDSSTAAVGEPVHAVLTPTVARCQQEACGVAGGRAAYRDGAAEQAGEELWPQRRAALHLFAISPRRRVHRNACTGR